MQPIWNRLNVEVLLTQFVAWLPALFSAIVLFAAFWLLYRLTRPTVRRVLERTGFDPALASMLTGIYKFTVLIFGIVMAASQLGINVGAALAGLGVIGLTFGFAAKDSVSNIIAGFVIFWDKPFHVNDWVTIGSHYGSIGEITMRTTRLRTRRNTWVIIPNEKIINEVLVNHSTRGEVRLEVPIGIAYGESIPQARGVILEALSKIPVVLKDPAPQVIVNDLAESSVNILVLAWIADAKDEKPAFTTVLERVKLSLDEARIEIPFPHLQLRIDAVEQQVWDQAGLFTQSARSAAAG